MLLYAITDRALLAGNEVDRSEKLVALASEWSANGVDFIQIREKDLPHDALIRLACGIVQAARSAGSRTQIIINADPRAAAAIALEAAADGIHLASGLDSAQLSQSVAEMRVLWQNRRDSPISPPISVSCHSIAEVRAARSAGAALALFAPVFEKSRPAVATGTGQGLEALAEACRAGREPAAWPELPVFALGGVTAANTPHCLAAGAAGIAAIRLFLRQETGLEQDWRQLTRDRRAVMGLLDEHRNPGESREFV